MFASLDLLCLGNVVGDQYRYMADLHSLEATATGTGPKCFIPATPLVMRAWCQALEDHPDKEFMSGVPYWSRQSKRDTPVKAW